MSEKEIAEELEAAPGTVKWATACRPQEPANPLSERNQKMNDESIRKILEAIARENIPDNTNLVGRAWRPGLERKDRPNHEPEMETRLDDPAGLAGPVSR